MNLRGRFLYGLTLLWIKWASFLAGGIEIEDLEKEKFQDLSWSEFLENLDDLIYFSGALLFVTFLYVVAGPEVDR